MAKEINPFIVTGKIEPEYFCDRVKESERLVKSLTNGNNLVIISPRRMGKTGLIRFCTFFKKNTKKCGGTNQFALRTSPCKSMGCRFSDATSKWFP